MGDARIQSEREWWWWWWWSVVVGGGRWWCRIGDGGTHTGWWTTDLRTVRKEGADAGRAPYKSCGHYSVTAGLNLSRGRKLDAKGNADLSDAKRSVACCTAYVSRPNRFSSSFSSHLSIPPSSFFLFLFIPPPPRIQSRIQIIPSSYLSRCFTISS